MCDMTQRMCDSDADREEADEALRDKSSACCSVLQCVAVCCSVLQCVAVCCSGRERQVGACCIALQCEL